VKQSLQVHLQFSSSTVVVGAGGKLKLNSAGQFSAFAFFAQSSENNTTKLTEMTGTIII
jgi:hypothetical protein